MEAGIQTQNSQPLTFGAASCFWQMELEEAIIIGLLAVGMSALIALTIMLFW